MICFPNAKINLGLHVLEKRADNFHQIETVMVPVNWCDALEFQTSGQFNLTTYGMNEKWNSDENLVTKAWRILHEKYAIPALEVNLYKSIPAGSGLGGGSSDAAFFIKTLNNAFLLGMNVEKMKLLASELGSDCSFFIENKPMLVSGKGEILEPINLNLKNYYVLIVKPGKCLSTTEAYRYVNPKNPTEKLANIIQKPIHFWKNELKNDFEEIAFEIIPELAGLKEQLYRAGAIYASLSGSGSAIYGIFENEISPGLVFKNCTVREGFLFN
jgi:4-diphosphocytidyl-2-C-methyl-D-erythritol kinase